MGDDAVSFAYVVGFVVGPLFAWFLIHVNRADARRALEIEAQYGPQLAALAQGDPEPGSSSPEPVAVDADHVPVAGTVSS